MTHLPSTIEHINTSELVPYARNSRTHSPEQNAIKAIRVNPPGSPHYKPPKIELERLKRKIAELEALWD